VQLFLRDLKYSGTSAWGTRVMSQKSCNVDLLGNGGGHSYEGPPLKNANGPAAGGSTSKSGGSTSKAMHGNLFSSLTQAQAFSLTMYIIQSFVVTCPPVSHKRSNLCATLSCPWRPQPKLAFCSYFLITHFPGRKISLFLVLFSLLFSIGSFSFWPDGQISSRTVWVTHMLAQTICHILAQTNCQTWHESCHITRVIIFEWESVHTIVLTRNSRVMIPG